LAVQQAGLVPVACDTRSGHFDFCPDALQACCNEQTLAVMPTHLGGRLADMEVISSIAKKAGAYVVEDAAQALGAMWQGRPAGSIGDIGVYSLGVGKGLTIYGGGGIVASDETLREQLKATSQAIVTYDIRREAKRVLELVGYTALYSPSALTFVYGMPLRLHLQHDRLLSAVGDIHPHHIPLHRVGNWRKHVGASALQHLPWFLAQTKAQAARRKLRLQGMSGVEVLEDRTGDSGTWPVLMLVMPSQQARDKALKTLWPAGLGVGRMFIHALPDYPDLSQQFPDADTPNARDFAARMLTISNSPWLKDDGFETICNVIEASLG
jgi:dTDP-4-amino-4,6-dideoxygalactose transaminase